MHAQILKKMGGRAKHLNLTSLPLSARSAHEACLSSEIP
jgi:hypothetical protein